MPVEIPPGFRELSADDKLELINALWDIFLEDPHAFPLTPEQEAELHRRLEFHRRHPDMIIPWQDVRDLLTRTTEGRKPTCLRHAGELTRWR